MSDIAAVAHTLVKTLEKLGVVYWIGGSMASAVHGVPRSTQDVDFIAELKEEHVDDLVAALESDFYIDREVVRRAVRSQRSFNVIHLGTMYKADVFVMGADNHAQAEKNRRAIEPLGPEPNSPTAYFCSAEDIVLQKLRWFRKGGGISERQWNDILSVLKVQINTLDYDYLKHWAMELEVADLLLKAFDDAGIDPPTPKA
ncbi:MAG TPA: hypothetical protein VFY40_00955 [Blastocatellia bacterium]|nr:hypothetical protein [Blastocatellia bacterium]